MSNPIGWCEDTWVPYVGCDKVSPGCEHCYAISMSWRLAHIPMMGSSYKGIVEKTKGGKLNWTGVIKENLSQADKPLRTKKPTMFFVNSMSDMFHEALSFDQIDQLFEIMSRCPQHTFQVLTKRAKHMYEYYGWKEKENGFRLEEWPLKNVWLGVSAENQKYADERIPLLLECPAQVRFLSCEPLLVPIDLKSIQITDAVIDCLKGVLIHTLNGEAVLAAPINESIHQVIIGGESGHEARPMNPDWVRDIIKQCLASGTAIYFKQFGEWAPVTSPPQRGRKGIAAMHHFEGNTVIKIGKKKAGNTIDGKQYLQFPKTERPCI